ncbi:MAG TPA: TetR/AcrR family transcriptional regulator [Ramlibacter sp.]|uniref:TetR/AcrR family transcriptional regulator n=1 Tax=Ramlibacter sp. TaxID=1917967 RepID=UPI002D05C397|nr:TetR/AcrR family transcriptional regulator [Ramlibacter sp.]HVZ45783.1 TetR/AcrR family transcriptional regulator [Ramlibacter sp.]
MASEITEARRTQRERREESELRMLRAGTRLIAWGGVASTTLAAIGVEAGYSRGLPVYAFKSKQGFITALLNSMEQWFDATLKTALKGKSGLLALEARIGAHFDGVKRNPVAVSALYAIYIESLFGMPEVRPAVEELSAKWRDGFLFHLREAHALGEIEGDDLEGVAALLLGMVRGMLIEHLMSNRRLDLESVGTHIARFVRAMRSAPLAEAGRPAS